eukprot:Skav208954  [mRNA]  locus=scaffold1580:180695:183406:- [translate_table: standard]
MLNKRVGAFGEVWGEDFVLSDACLQVHYLTRDALMEVIDRNEHNCPQIVRRYCVRLAVYRGIIAEARRRAKQMIKQKACRGALACD